MRKIILIYLALLALNLSAQQYVTIDYNEKNKGDDLLFSVTFDKNSVNADFARGNSKSTTLKDLNLGLRGMIGFDGKQAFLAERNEELKFEAEKNINLQEGTIILWVCPRAHDPESASTNGIKRGNNALFEAKFFSGENNLSYRLSDFNGTNYFEWANSYPPQGWGQTKYAEAKMTGIKKGSWYQLVATWTPNEIKIFLNGECVATTALPMKSSKTINMKPEKQSYIGIRNRFYGDENKYPVVLDDVKIYAKALSPILIKSQYLKLCKSIPAGMKVSSFGINLSGVDQGNGKKGLLEAEFDFSPLAEQFKQVQDKVLDIIVTGPNNYLKTRSVKPDKINQKVMIDGVNRKGKYTVDATIKFADGTMEKNTSSIDVPDLNFEGNKIGMEDEIPPPWTALILEPARIVKLWNREYRFGKGPFPEAVFVNGKNILKHGPELFICSPSKADIQWSEGETRRGQSWIEFTGKGTAVNFTIDYITRVEFDGMIKSDFTINGNPEISSMKIVWQVNPQYSKYLMTPIVDESKKDPVSFTYTTEINQDDPHFIWLVSESGGFSFNVESDANWNYRPEERIFSSNRKTGYCSVTMISGKIKMPDAVPYQAIFTATPTRPLPEEIRGLRFYHHGTPRKIFHNIPFGFESQGSCRPADNFETEMKKGKAGEYIYYSMADALTDQDQVMVYFRKYWNIPGAYSYQFGHSPYPNKKLEVTYSLSACPHSSFFNDYLINNQNEFYKLKLSDRFSIIYYDLCGDVMCANEEHGCLFKDKFGRLIKKTSILAKRNLVMRTVRLAHKNDKAVMLHAQRSYCPLLHGLGDYWFTGEQYGALLGRNSYGYTDEVPELHWQTEFNRELIGTGVIMNSSVGWVKPENLNDVPLTEAMLSAVLPYDIEVSALFANETTLSRIYKIYADNGVYEKNVKPHLFSSQRELAPSDPEGKVSWYEIPHGGRLLVIANSSPRKIDLEITVKGAIPADCKLKDDYNDSIIDVSNGKLKLSVKARNFRLLSYKNAQ